jgi:hypothetical protein
MDPNPTNRKNLLLIVLNRLDTWDFFISVCDKISPQFRMSSDIRLKVDSIF